MARREVVLLRIGRLVGGWLRWGLVLALCTGGLGSAAAAEGLVRNGFPLEPASIPADEIIPGGPPRDGIPSLEHPPAVRPADASWEDDAMVMGVTVGDQARAYPTGILGRHELVNDTLGGTPILVSFCPLCGTGMVFDRRVDGEVLEFGVSGLLYQSDLLMYDRASESLWSQISAEAVTGPRRGTRLDLLRSTMMSWGDWRRKHPGTTVLSRETGYDRDYDQSPYGDYATSEFVGFRAPVDPRYHPKMPTLGLRVPGRGARADPASELAGAGGQVKEEFLGFRVRVAYDPDRQVFEVEAPPEVDAVEGFWFAWAAFHPETSVFRASSSEKAPSP